MYNVRKRRVLFKMKKALIFICAGIILMFSILNEKNKIKVEAYFPNAAKNLLKSEKRNIGNNLDKENILRQTIEILFSEPKNKKLSAFQVANVDVKKIYLNDKTVTIDFSPQYKNLPDELFFRSALVWTLTDLDFVDNVKIFVDGQELQKIDGTPIGILNRSNIVINPEISDEKTDSQIVKLYFRKGNKLYAQDRLINIDLNQPIEKYILEQIILGPSSSDLLATVSPDTKICDVKTDKDICYVSLSGGFTNKNNDNDNQKFALYSIVNSLTELKNINKVQFLIESEKTNQSKWLNKPIERNEKIIYRDKK